MKTQKVVSFLNSMGVRINKIEETESQSEIQTDHLYTKWQGQKHWVEPITLILQIVPEDCLFLEGIDLIGFDDQDDFPGKDDLQSIVHKGLKEMGIITEWDCDAEPDDYTEYNRIFDIQSRWGRDW